MDAAKRDEVVLWTAGTLSFVLGTIAASTAGILRGVSLVLLYVAAISLVVVTNLPGARLAKDSAVGGTGYRPPIDKRVRIMHVALTVVYNLGIFIVVFAAMAKLGTFRVAFYDAMIRGFPIIIGAYVLMLAAATKWRIEERGGVYKSWHSRAHGIFLALVTLPIVILAILLVSFQSVDVRIMILEQRDLLVFILIGVLGIGTQLFLELRLPTLVDLVTQWVRVLSGKTAQTERSNETPPLVYTFILAIALTSVLAFIGAQINLMEHLNSAVADGRITFVIILFPIGIAVFFLLTTAAIWREGRRGLYTMRMTRKLRNDLLVYGLSTIFGLLFAILTAIGLMTDVTSIAGLDFQVEKTYDDGRTEMVSNLPVMETLVMLTFVASMAPIGIYISREHRRINEIEERLPDFLNDLAEARRAGLPLAIALENTALSDYGSLSPEIDKMAKQVKWGVSFDDALVRMAKRVRSSLVERAVTLIVEASKTGGSVAEVLKAASRDAYELKALESDRRVSMFTYVLVVYVVFFVFLAVISIMDSQFIPPAVEAAAKAREAGAGTAGGNVFQNFNIGASLDPESLRWTYFIAIVVQGVGNGLVGGVLTEGRIMAGFKHAAIMVFAGWFTFFLILQGMNPM